MLDAFCFVLVPKTVSEAGVKSSVLSCIVSLRPAWVK
ncbi:mCG147401 [Mus musculus]|nr:mCG147401 [Mus musculus]